MKKILIFVFIITTTAMWSCKEDESPYYSGESYVQFSQVVDNITSHTFVYSSDDVTETDIELRVDLLGYLSPDVRYFEIEQVEHVAWDYILDDYGNIKDSVNLNLKQAVAGVHYKTPAKDDLRIEPNATKVTIPLTLLRDASLQNDDHYLRLRLVASGDLLPGYGRKVEHVVRITDKLIQPSKWGSSITNYFFGEYSVAKHRMMIEVTQMVWEDEMILALLEDDIMADYYIGIFKQELARREDEAGGPILDENGNRITFPR